ncbi:MAG: hypothetical protein FRX49_12264 [Trebouxia sp. A1-2]|nr:MAG: hypothetical protein FRX49_12264 [Trebouxia sp. A1-2]
MLRMGQPDAFVFCAKVMTAVRVLAWLCGGSGCWALLEPEVPGSKAAAGHVGVALPTPSCQVTPQA